VVNQRITLGSCSCCLQPIKCISGPASVVASWLSAIVMLSPTCHVQQVQVFSNSPCNIYCRAAEYTAQQNTLHTQLQAWCALWRVSTRRDEQPMSRCQVYVKSWQNFRTLSYQKGCHCQMLLQYFQVIGDFCLCCCLHTILLDIWLTSEVCSHWHQLLVTL
jgi:hypothetical protein